MMQFVWLVLISLVSLELPGSQCQQRWLKSSGHYPPWAFSGQQQLQQLQLVNAGTAAAAAAAAQKRGREEIDSKNGKG